MTILISRRMIALMLGLLTLGGSALAGRLEKVTEKVEAEGARRLEVSLEFGVGQLTVGRDDMAEAAVINIEYDKRRVDYDISYDLRGSTGELYLESNQLRRKNSDGNDNWWDLTLSTRYPTDLQMEIGACDAEMDLGGVPLTNFTMDIGAASGLIEFSRSNPERLDDLDIDAGAASLEMDRIGNANFDQFSFAGGAGSFELDFRGEYEEDSRIDIEVGLGSADIVLPEDVAVRLETSGDGWLSSVDLHGGDVDEVDDDVWESPGFDNADVKLFIAIDVGLGSVDVYWR